MSHLLVACVIVASARRSWRCGRRGTTLAGCTNHRCRPLSVAQCGQRRWLARHNARRMDAPEERPCVACANARHSRAPMRCHAVALSLPDRPHTHHHARQSWDSQAWCTCDAVCWPRLSPAPRLLDLVLTELGQGVLDGLGHGQPRPHHVLHNAQALAHTVENDRGVAHQLSVPDSYTGPT